jgi:hypothetical protein
MHCGDGQSLIPMGSNTAGRRLVSTQPPRGKQEISTRKDDAGAASVQGASMEIDMATLRKLTALLLAAPLVLGIGPAQADDWADYGEGYSDGYSDGYHSGYGNAYSDYEPRYRSSRSDVGGALALGVIGGVALGAIATSRAPTPVIVHEDSGCYRTWERAWNRYSGTYQRKRVLICN